MNDAEHNTQWKQALEICESISDLSVEQKYQHIVSLELEEGVKQKVLKIINRLDEKNVVLDESNCSYFINDIENDKDIVGQCIDNYQLIKRIAQGGMSSIYEAILVESDVQNHVAIKILSPYVFSEKSLELFKREQIILSKLKHPNIVSFHHSGQTQDGTQYLVMEFIENALTINEYCLKQNLTVESIVDLIIDVSDVLAYSHNNLIIHRDIKTDNILVDEQGRVKVIDFGIGRYDSEASQEATQVFTVDTASPEQILGKHVTVQTDVFSLGALLLQLLVRKKPLPKTNVRQYNPQDDVSHINKLLHESGLDKDLKNIIRQAMHIDVNQRYASMSVFSQDLKNWKNHKPVLATTDTYVYRISKFYQRNKVTSLLVALIFFSTLLSAVFIYQSETAKQLAESKKLKSLEIIRSVFQQVNPLKKQYDESTLTAGLDSIKDENKMLLDADPELKFLIYSEMAELYRSNNFYHKAQENTEQALQALALFTSKNDQQYLNTQADYISILVANGQYQHAIDKGLQLVSELKSNETGHMRALIVTNLSVAKSYYILNETAQARQYLELSYKYMNRIAVDVITRADAYNLTALIHKKENNFELASQSYLDAIELLRNSKLGKKDLVINLTNFGVLLVDQNKYEEAEKYYLEAKQIIEAVDRNHTQIAVVNIQYASLLRLTKRFKEAQDMLSESLSILEKANDKRQLIWIYRELCKFALHHNEISEALYYFQTGYTLSKELYGVGHSQTLEFLNKLLSVALIASRESDVQKLFDGIDSHLTENVFDTLEYEDYQIHLATHEKQKMVNQYHLSSITEFLYDPFYKNKVHRKQWLENQLDASKTHPIIKNFAQLWVQEFSANEQVYVHVCKQTDDWGFTHHYQLKLLFLQLCTETAKKHDFEQLDMVSQQLALINAQIEQNQAVLEQTMKQVLADYNKQP